jgi:nicotinamide riboside kinase
MIRIAITGPESCGKTSLSIKLAEYFGVSVIPEFARTFLEEKQGVYEKSDLDKIAKKQVDLWNNDARFLICDTELTVLKIWSEVKYGSTSSLIQALYEEQTFDHYFLCKPDIPWEPDPLREHPNDRDILFEYYENELQSLKRNYSIVSGTLQERLNQCLKFLRFTFQF